MVEQNKDKTCGECARFKVPNGGCTWSGEGTLRASDKACSDFYQSRFKKEKKEKKPTFKDSGFIIDGCFEAIYHNGKPAFLVKNSGDFIIRETVDVADDVYNPKTAKHVPYEPYGYFAGAVPSREELFWKVRSEFDVFIDVEPIWKDVLATCTMLTYHQEKLQTVPYLFPYGDNESGKTTILNVLSSLCYRPLNGVTIPAADLYGYLEDSDSIGCILEDEVQGIYKDIDKVKIYKAGYKQGAMVPRTIMTQFDRIIKYYRTFCFKVCASEQIPQVKGFNERFLFCPMVEGEPQKEWADLSAEDVTRHHELRDTLLKWRMLERTGILPDVQTPFRGRLKELWKPILQISHGLTVYDTLFKFVSDQQKERLAGKQNTLEGHIVKVVTELHNDTDVPLDSMPFHRIWFELHNDLDGKIDDRKPHIMDTSEFFQVSKNKVGYRLREVLSGRTKVLRQKDGEGNWTSIKAYEFDQNKLRRVAKKYGYEMVTKLPLLPSSEGVQTLKTMEIEHENNVEKHVDTPLKLGNLSNSVTNEETHSEMIIPCPYCKKAGKTMNFSCDADLAAHVKTHHTGWPEYTS
jgi:sarcosine oxidase delta subunit